MTKSKYQLIVFDWEGTLEDPFGRALALLKAEFEYWGFDEWDEARARQSIVDGLGPTINKLLPQLESSLQRQLFDAVQMKLMSAAQEIYFFPGTHSLLQSLKNTGFDLAIATNRGMLSLQKAIHLSELASLFTITRSAGQTPPKPCPQMLQEILEFCHVPPSQALMVGDSASDMEMAQMLKVDAVGVDFYHQMQSELLAAGALEVFDNNKSLASFLRVFIN